MVEAIIGRGVSVVEDAMARDAVLRVGGGVVVVVDGDARLALEERSAMSPRTAPTMAPVPAPDWKPRK